MRKEGEREREERKRRKISVTRERGRSKERRRERTRRGRDEEGEREREGRERGERKTFLLPPLLVTEAISAARRHEERGEGRARERWRRNFPPPSPYARVCPHAGEEEGRWRRKGRCEKGRRERESDRTR